MNAADPSKRPDTPPGSPAPPSAPSHSLETGLGAAGGLAAGAALGAAAGPVGAIVGASIGAAAGAIGGKAYADALDPVHDEYWRREYRSRPYVQPHEEYEHYRPAYQYGWRARAARPGKKFEEVEDELQTDWRAAPGYESLEWTRFRPAVRDAWDRTDTESIDPTIPWDDRRDG